jgi:hypothetical protein
MLLRAGMKTTALYSYNAPGRDWFAFNEDGASSGRIAPYESREDDSSKDADSREEPPSQLPLANLFVSFAVRKWV